METPFGSAGFRPEAAFAGAAERFFELLKTLGGGGAGKLPDWSTLVAPLAGQFEQWLRMSQSSGPWFAAGGGGFPGTAAGAAAAAPWSFGPLPLGPAAAPGGDAQRTWELLSRFSQLQGQLATHWSEIANTAARRFVARLGSAATPAGVDQAMKLYELWVNCAEEAYAATAHQPDFSRLQAELANTSAALLVEQRRHAETLVRAFGLPTRNEVDALYAQVKELRRQLAEVTPGAAAPEQPPRKRATASAAARPAPRKRPRPPAARGPGKRRAARRPRA